MKKSFCNFFIALFAASYLFASAKFINKDTLQVVAQGRAKKSGSQMRDQANCKEAARNEAMRLAIEALVDKNWPNVKGKVSKEQYGQKVTQLTEGTIKGGQIVSSQVDSSGDEVKCTVTLRVERFDAEAVHRSAMRDLGLGDIQMASARGDQGNNVAEIYKTEQLGPLSIGDSERQIVAHLGKQKSSTNNGSKADAQQIWSYPSAGIEIKMEKKGTLMVVRSVTVRQPSRFATKKGVKIGSTLARLKKAYSAEIGNNNLTTADRVIIGSSEHGLVFQLRDGKVDQIFLGSR